MIRLVSQRGTGQEFIDSYAVVNFHTSAQRIELFHTADFYLWVMHRA